MALLVAVIGVLLTFFAAPLTEWIARAPEIGAAVQEKLRVFDYPLSVLRDIKNAVMPAAAHGPTVSVESNPAEIVGAALARDHAGGQPVRGVLRHADLFSRSPTSSCGAS